MRTIIVAALGAFGGTLGYAYILNAPKNTILPASFIGLAGYMAYVLLGMAGFGTMSAYFLSTVLVSVVCELLARKMRTPATIFLLSALVPLVPGYNFYLAMLALVENRGAAAAQEGMVAVQIVAAIAIHNIPEGIAVSIPIYYATGDRRKAFRLSLLSGLAEPVGAILAWLVLTPFMTPTLMGCILAGVAGIMVFISIDELLPAAREYGEAHISIYGVVAGMALMAVSLILLA